MAKHVEFGKDLGLMAEVVRRGLSVGIGHWEFWEAFSGRPQPALWAAMHQFLNIPTEMYWRQRKSWPKGSTEHHLHVPEIDAIDSAVREGRKNNFGKKEWQLLAENGLLFEALVEYLCLAPPFSTVVEVDYDQLPLYQDGYTPLGFFPDTEKKGVLQREMSIYVPRQRMEISRVEDLLYRNNWNFADQNELYAFGRRTKQHVRPWALIDEPPIYGLATQSDSQAGGITFPRLWTIHRNHKLDLGAYAWSEGGRSIMVGDHDHLLIVKD